MTKLLPLVDNSPHTTWFAARSCIVARGNKRDIIVGGFLVGSFGPEDSAARNLLLVGLAEDPDVHLGQLAKAAGMVPESLRQLRRAYEEKGLAALVERTHGGSDSKMTSGTRKKLKALFESGASVSKAFASVGPKAGSRATVGRVRTEWASQKSASIHVPAPNMASAEALSQDSMVEAPSGLSSEPSAEEDARLTYQAAKSAPVVQHVGAWILIAAAHALGLYRHAYQVAGGRVRAEALRIALDAVVVALGLGERCVEGTRRLATSSAAVLLLAARAPSPTWTRRTLGRFAQDGGGAALHLTMAREYVTQARTESQGEGPVFYVDNHLRLYTGKQVVRRGWRMQDKRVRPGTTDYYVHDEDGRPVGRATAPHHGLLTDFLSPITGLLRLALPEEKILVAFDRAGAFPTQLAALRDAETEFVTYERRPYALLAQSEFAEEIILDDERLRLCESRKNLSGGRGRVRRICVRTAEGRQINLLANSDRPAWRLVEIMRGRWNQENGFKHGKERWGINQLDGRTVRPYPPDTVIPNPARRRLDAALRIARVREALALAALVRTPEGDERRGEIQREVEEALAEQHRLEAVRPATPLHAALKDTELAEKLVHHTVEYKLALDTIRIACANAESELAASLAPHLPRAAEAKKALANLFAAPGRVHVGCDAITVTLRPAGSRLEQISYTALMSTFNARRLPLPGDQDRRPLRFRIAQSS